MRNYNFRYFFLIVTLLICSNLYGQFSPPIIRVKSGPEKPIELKRLKTVVRVFGKIAETEMTMTFFNPNQRTLEGELYFPLPEGAKVSGYALDVNGDLVDGVMVTKAKARQVFETEVRKGVDPGIIEKVKGNNFKTRVYPLSPNQSRIVRVTFLSSLTETNNNFEYRLPVKLSKKIKNFLIRFELADLANKPKLEAKGLGNFNFDEWNTGFFAEKKISGKELETEVRLSIPDSDQKKVFTQTGSDGNTYFIIQDKIKAEVKFESATTINKAAIFYDASNSFSTSRKEKEKSFLKEFFRKFTDIKDIKLIEFRNRVSQVTAFNNVDSVINAIDSIQYDGGTCFGNLKLPEGFVPDVVLLFSDGLQTFGEDTPARIAAPVYSVVSSDGADFPFLRNISAASGGLLLNLNRFAASKLINKIGKKIFSFLPDSGYAGVEELYPARPTPVQGNFFAAGILEAGQTEVKLKFGVNGQSQIERAYKIKSNSYEGDLIRKFWAGKKIDFLSALAEKNKTQIISTSKKHSVLSQFTSMIVLERAGQYIEHEIIPPKSKPEWRKNYFDVLEKRAAEDKAFKDSKLEQVVKMWNERIKWWKKDYNISPDFRISSSRHKKSRSRNGGAPGAVMREAVADGFGSEVQRSISSSVSPEPSMQRDEMLADDEAMLSAAPQEEAKMMSKEDQAKPSRRNVEPGVAIKAWDPKTPYTKRIKKAKESMMFAQYIEEKKEYGTSPAFYLDCSDVFRKAGKKDLALQILSNIAELELENSALIRVLAHRLAQLEELELSALLFEEVLKMREEEPQSYRDLALVYGRLGKFKKAVELLYEVVLKKWDSRFPEIEVIVLEEMNNLIEKGKRQGFEDFKVDSRLVKLLDVDLRIVMTWDADMTDMDLWVIEPSNEKAYYSNPRSQIGGLVSRDFTRGYGPEEYMIKKAMTGMYKIQTNFFGSSQQKLAGAVTLQVDVFSNYGRKNEKRKSTTIRLKENKQTFTVADIEF